MVKYIVLQPDNEELFGAKKNELSNHKKTWRNLKCILVSKRNQSEKAVYCMIPTL